MDITKGDVTTRKVLSDSNSLESNVQIINNQICQPRGVLTPQCYLTMGIR